MKRDRTQAVAGDFQKFEIVWARLDGRRWRLAKILLPDSHKAGNFIVASPTTQKIFSIEASNLRKHIAGSSVPRGERSLYFGLLKTLGKAAKVLKKPPSDHRSINSEAPYVEAQNTYNLRSSSRHLQPVNSANPLTFAHSPHRFQENHKQELSQIQSESNLSERPSIEQGRNPSQRLDDTTLNFDTLGVKLVVIAKKFYKVLKRKGLNQGEAQVVSIRLTQYNNSHNPKETFHRLLHWIRVNSPDYILRHYPQF